MALDATEAEGWRARKDGSGFWAHVVITGNDRLPGIA